ncbi:UrcA family protein [Novosphingobium sp. YJ-S2-02]|uniref:UrcA family protein n=1 Tax=Novosphingobium aureum TaxID=2792964 RepID=A0A931HAR1_9SPHN|nr:UrcA family protein [Novosphingobium aureum]MBH0112501.1 UrcA family protein [Novosphingobium aureum]
MKTLSIAAAAGIALLATPVIAEEVIVQKQYREDVPTREVRYDDLNILSSAGMDTFTNRIDRAVRYVCGAPDIRALNEMAHMQNCRVESTQRAYAARDEIVNMQMAARANGMTLASAEVPTLRVAR